MDQPVGASAQDAQLRAGSAQGDPRDTSRDRILTVALDEFARKGFEGTTTAEIARRAEVTQPLVHYHFESKDELWRAALSDLLGQMDQTFGGSMPELSDLDTVAKLKVLLRRFVHFSAAHPELGRIMAYEGSAGGERLRWLLEQQSISQLGVFVELLRRAATEGAAKSLAMEHVAVCVGAAAAYLFVITETMRSIYGVDVTDPEVIELHADTVVELCFHGLLRSDSNAGAVL